MNADAIRETLNHQPFEPFEIIMSSGERHLIKHPEFLMLTPSRAVLVDPITDRVSVLSVRHVRRIGTGRQR
jgi:hypothetical protein